MSKVNNCERRKTKKDKKLKRKQRPYRRGGRDRCNIINNALLP